MVLQMYTGKVYLKKILVVLLINTLKRNFNSVFPRQADFLVQRLSDRCRRCILAEVKRTYYFVDIRIRWAQMR